MNRFVISGCQLGMLIGMPTQEDRQKEANKIMEFQRLEYSEKELMADINRYKRLLEENPYA